MKKITAVVVFVLSLYGFAYANNYALLFDGSNDFVTVPDSSSLRLSTGMTIEAWIKSYDTNGPRDIVSKWNDPLSQRSYIFKNHNSSDKLRIELTPYVDLAGNTSIVTNNWIHVATTYDSSEIKLYYNGVLDGSTPWTVPINPSAAELLIGAVNGDGWGGLESFSGIIDEVRIWNYARTGEQLQDWKNYSLMGNESGLVGYWNFDEGSGQTAYDLTGYHNDGMLGSTADSDLRDPTWVLSDGQYGQQRNVVPEPTSILLFGIGGLATAALKRKKKIS